MSKDFEFTAAADDVSVGCAWSTSKPAEELDSLPRELAYISKDEVESSCKELFNGGGLTINEDDDVFAAIEQICAR